MNFEKILLVLWTNYVTKPNNPNQLPLYQVKITILTTYFRHHQYNRRSMPLYRAKETNLKSLKLFMENIEEELFDTAAVRNVWPNVLRGEIEAVEDIRLWNNQTVCVEDKGSCFVILGNNYDE